MSRAASRRTGTPAPRGPWQANAAAWALYAVAAAAVLGALGIAVEGIARGRDFWFDETWTLSAARRSALAAIHFFLPDAHPPLYYLLMSAWVEVFGAGRTAVRGFSLLAVALALPLLWWQGRRMLPPPALALAAVLLYSNWTLAYYAQETRMYALAMLGALWVALGFARLWNGDAAFAAGQPPSDAAQRVPEAAADPASGQSPEAAAGAGQGAFAGQPPPSLRQVLAYAPAAAVLSLAHYYLLALAGCAFLLLLWRCRRALPQAAVLCACGLLPLAWVGYHLPRMDLAPVFAWMVQPSVGGALGDLARLALPQLETGLQYPRLLAPACFAALVLAAAYHRQVADWYRRHAAAPHMAVVRSQLLLALTWIAAVLLVQAGGAGAVQRYMVPLVPVSALALAPALALALGGRPAWLAGVAAALAASGLWVAVHHPTYFWQGRADVMERQHSAAAVRGMAAETDAPVLAWWSQHRWAASVMNEHLFPDFAENFAPGQRFSVIRSADARHPAPPYLLRVHCGPQGACRNWIDAGVADVVYPPGPNPLENAAGLPFILYFHGRTP